MKIYFAGSIRGGREDQNLYLRIIECLKQYGEVLTEHIGEADLTSHGEELDEEEIFKRDVLWINDSDLIVVELTQPSLGVGYEIALSQILGKKILGLFRNGEGTKLSAMILGIKELDIFYYNKIEDVIYYIKGFMKNLISSRSKD